MFGTGVVKGLAVTLREFVLTYVDDIKKIPSRYAGGRGEIDQTMAVPGQTGLFTIQYPEEHRKLPERFRYIPMLIYEAETGEDLCTACGICAKVCPPQCIWIVRDRDANGKPITRPAEFDIDASICMNCGLCAEYCPFDAIKMNHEFEIAAYQRMPDLVFKVNELRVPTTYYAKLYPVAWAEEEAARVAKAKEKEAKAAKPAAAPAAAASPSAVPAATAAATAAASAAASAAPAAAGGRPTPEELERRRAEARARKAAQEGIAAAGGDAAAAASPAPTEAAPPPAQSAAPAAPSAGGRLSPEEIERRRTEARARKAAQQAAQQADQAGAAGSEEPPQQ